MKFSPSHVGPDPSLRRQQTAMASEGNRGNNAGYHWVGSPPHPNPPKKNRTRELCFSREVNVRKLRLQCWGGIYWSKGGVKWSYMLILWDERVATANCTLFNFFSGLFRMQEMLHSAGLVALFCFQILFSRRPFSGEFCLPTLWVLRNYWPAVFLNQVPSLINNKKH